MKNKYFPAVIICCWLLFHTGHGMSIQKNYPPIALTKLAKNLGLPQVTTWKEAKEAFSCWGRKPGQERWELHDIKLENHQEKAVKENLRELGILGAVSPARRHYDYAVILGGTVPVMIKRFDYLVKQWESGVRFNQIVFLLGHRPLSDTADHFTSSIIQWSPKARKIQWDKKTLPLDETEAAELIYFFATLPKKLENIPVSYYRTPRRWQPESNQWQRANTAMTIHSWLKQQPSSGKVLVVSSQPNLLYQQQVFTNIMPSDFTVETIAPASSSTSIAVALDAVWLWIKNHQ